MRTKTNIRSTFAVLFYIDKSKITKQGVCVIAGRISVDAQSVRFSTKQYIEPDRWDSKSGRAVGKS
ncbi:MAG: Arm DNA-binding domain-containing protein [Tannerellaceae bacterium]